MNERIRELALQAGFIKFKTYDNYEYLKTPTIPVESWCLDTELGKFAELIVRECIREIGYKSAELLDIDFYPHYQERLKKHFGVE